MEVDDQVPACTHCDFGPIYLRNRQVFQVGWSSGVLVRSLSVHSQPHREPVERTEDEDKGQMTIQPVRPEVSKPVSKQPGDRRLKVLSEGPGNEDKCLTKGH